MKSVLVLLLCLCCVYAKQAPRRVLVMGDWGQELTSSARPNQERVSRAMGHYLEANPDVAYIVSTGDNFYCCGVTSPESVRFQNTWREVYQTDDYPVMRDLRWYISVGNHDHTDDDDEWNQVGFSDLDDKWYFPHLWYDYLDDELDELSVHWVVFDSQALRHNKHNPAEQRAFLDEAMRESTADYVIVVGHHPALNAGRHGGSSTIRNQVLPLAVEHEADILIVGHDHNLQHIQDASLPADASYVDQVITGGGGRHLYPVDSGNLADLENRGYQLSYFIEAFGFTVLSFEEDQMTVDYFALDEQGDDYSSVYTFSRPNFRGRKFRK